MTARRFATLLALLLSLPLALPDARAAQALDRGKIDGILGRAGLQLGDVYRVAFPRTDLRVTVGSVAIRPGFALGSWAGFTGSDDDAMVMGDLVLLEREVAPVLASLRAAGFEITALHNHLLGETPHVLYMHYLGHGQAAGLARNLRTALAESKTPLGKPAPSSWLPPPRL